MANLVYAISASLDGYIADENDNFDWTHPSDDVHAFFNDLQRSVGLRPWTDRGRRRSYRLPAGRIPDRLIAGVDIECWPLRQAGDVGGKCKDARGGVGDKHGEVQ